MLSERLLFNTVSINIYELYLYSDLNDSGILDFNAFLIFVSSFEQETRKIKIINTAHNLIAANSCFFIVSNCHKLLVVCYYAESVELLSSI